MRRALIEKNLEKNKEFRKCQLLNVTLCNCKSTERKKQSILSCESKLYNHCGDGSVEDPPLLIPNTEVKLNRAESTWLDTAWEDRELPHFNIPR